MLFQWPPSNPLPYTHGFQCDATIAYANADHAHANTETIVGHATLATGAYPAAHGMVANLWFDRETGTTTYYIEDARYKLLTAGTDIEIDPRARRPQRRTLAGSHPRLHLQR